MEEPKFQINPDREKPWNDLPDLPIDESFYRNVAVLEQLGNSKSALARLQGRSIAIPNQGVLINTISLQEAKASSEIENIFTTDDELYQAFSEKQTEIGLSGSAKEVLRYREALWNGHHHLKEKGKFDAAYFIKLYQTIKQTNDQFRPEFAKIVIKQGGSGPNAGKAIYTPPRGSGMIESKMSNLIEFVNDDAKYPLDPLIKMAIAHYQFEAIHPFRDGNGRSGRIFNINLLTQKGLLDLPILFLSKYIIDQKNDYYALLAGVTQRGKWIEWILYMLNAVETTANITYNKINDILAAKEGITEAINQQTKIRKAEQLIQQIFIHPLTKVSHLTDSNLYAENTARNYLNQLTAIGVLEKKTIAGHHYYLNLELYRILAE